MGWDRMGGLMNGMVWCGMEDGVVGRTGTGIYGKEGRKEGLEIDGLEMG